MHLRWRPGQLQCTAPCRGSSAGASQTVPVRAGELKKGHYVMLKDHPCKVRVQERLGQLPAAQS